MTTYTIHEPSARPADMIARAEAVDFVKEGVAWWALLFPLLWLLYHRMWIVLIGLVALLVALQLGLGLIGLSETAIGWSMVAVSILFAVHANDLRRWTLARRGYEMVGAVTGRNRNECELKFFSDWAPAQTAEPAQGEQVTPNKPTVLAARKPGPQGGDDVIGLFPGTDR